MPDVKIVNLDRTIRVGFGANLRKALLANGVSPYKGFAKVANCHGMGSCGTCGVVLRSGETNDQTLLEKLHRVKEPKRLSCQTKVYGDCEIEMLNVAEPAVSEPAEKESARSESGAS